MLNIGMLVQWASIITHLQAGQHKACTPQALLSEQRQDLAKDGQSSGAPVVPDHLGNPLQSEVDQSQQHHQVLLLDCGMTVRGLDVKTWSRGIMPSCTQPKGGNTPVLILMHSSSSMNITFRILSWISNSLGLGLALDSLAEPRHSLSSLSMVANSLALPIAVCGVFVYTV